MKGSLRVMLTACVFGMLLWMSVSAVRAEGAGTIAGGGTIAFVGAVVEPTCNVNDENAAGLVAASAQTSPRQFACASIGVNVSPAVAPQRYALSVVHLSDATPDRVLKYFNDYVRASQGSVANPVLVTQTYE